MPVDNYILRNANTLEVAATWSSPVCLPHFFSSRCRIATIGGFDVSWAKSVTQSHEHPDLTGSYRDR